MPQVSQLVGEINQDLPWFLAEPNPDAYKTAPWICMDMETTNLEKGSSLNENNRMVCSAWVTSDDLKIKYTYGGEFEQGDLLAETQRILAAGGFIIAHNAKFELGWLSRMGLDLYTAVTYDTLLGEYVRGGNRWMLQHLGLGKINLKYGGTGKMRVVDALIKGGVCPSMIPTDWLEARVRKDVADTVQVFYGQRRILIERDQLAVAWNRNLVTPCLTWIEQRGIALNRDRVYEEYDRASGRMAELNAKLDKFTGGINWKSTPQKAKFLYGRRTHPEEALQQPKGLGFQEVKGRRNKASKQFPEGVPKTDDKTLKKLKAKTKRQKEFLVLLKEASSINAQLSKTLEFFKGIVDEHDGVFHGSFNQANTATHRLSSSGRKMLMEQFDKEKSAQFQNMPRIFKDLMQPKRPGWRMGEVDGSQLEFRVAAYLGQDLVAIFDIRGDVDIHLFTASILFGVPEEEVTKEQRQAAKEHTFKPLYGGQSGTAAEKAYYAAFKAKYHGLYEEQTSWTYTVLNNKKLRTEWGMEYHWPRTRMSKDGFIDNTPSIFNYPVQAFATAEIVPIALVYLWHRLLRNNLETEIVNTVHDSAIAEIAPGEESFWCRLGLQAFTTDVYSYLDRVYDVQFNVPLGAGIIIGDRWNSPDAVETEINVEPDGEYWFKGSRTEGPKQWQNRDTWNKIAGMVT